MIIVTRVRWVEQTHEISPPEQEENRPPVSVIVHEQCIKVSAPDAYTITPETTLECMRLMSQKAWQHISTGELFQHLFRKLFGGDAGIPPTIGELLEEDKGVIHGVGLIVLLVESVSRTDRKYSWKHPRRICTRE